MKYLDAYGNNYYNTGGVYAFHRTEALYRAYPRKPFMFPEWGMTEEPRGVPPLHHAAVAVVENLPISSRYF